MANRSCSTLGSPRTAPECPEYWIIIANKGAITWIWSDRKSRMQNVHFIAKSHLVFRSRKKLESAAEMALRPAVTDCVDREKSRTEMRTMRWNGDSPRLASFSPLPLLFFSTRPQQQFNISFYAPMGNEDCSFLWKPTLTRSSLASGNRPLGMRITGEKEYVAEPRNAFQVTPRTKKVGYVIAFQWEKD